MENICNIKTIAKCLQLILSLNSNYSHQYHHHHRPRRKYGPYMVPSDPYLLHSGPSDYFFAGSAANATANLGANLTSVPPQHQHRPAGIQQRPNTLR